MSSVYSEVPQGSVLRYQQSAVISSAKSDSRNLLSEKGENTVKGQPLSTVYNSIWIAIYI